MRLGRGEWTAPGTGHPPIEEDLAETGGEVETVEIADAGGSYDGGWRFCR